MAVWLVRAGAKGEHEQKFVREGRIYLTKSKIDFDLGPLHSRDELLDKMTLNYQDEKPRKVSNHASQIWPFARLMQLDDTIILPSKLQSAIYVGQVISDYQYVGDNTKPYLHWREVQWHNEAIPRSSFAKDLLSSFSASMTICQIKRNDAENRLKAMAQNNWQALDT